MVMIVGTLGIGFMSFGCLDRAGLAMICGGWSAGCWLGDGLTWGCTVV